MLGREMSAGKNLNEPHPPVQPGILWSSTLFCFVFPMFLE